MMWLKQNKELIILVLVVILGLSIIFKNDDIHIGHTPKKIDLECAGIYVPPKIKLTEIYHYCSCVRAGLMETKAQRIAQCTQQFSESNEKTL